MRYFFVSYNYLNIHTEGMGNFTVSVDVFPNKEKLREIALKYCSKGSNYNISEKDIVVSNIFEFNNEDDYKSYNSK